MTTLSAPGFSMLCLVLGFWSAACLAQDKSVQFTATINLAVLDTSGTGVQDVEITVEPDDLWGMSMALYEFEIPDLPDCTLSLTGAGTTDAQGKATIEVTAKVSGRVLPNWGSQPWFSCWVKVLKKDVAPRFVRIMAHSGQTYVLKVQGFGAGGTDNHMVMVDITGTGKNGKEIEDLVGAQGVYVNKNFIPYDPRPNTETSGMRVGTPMVTTLGARESDMPRIVQFIDKAISGENVRKEVSAFMAEIEGRA